MQPYEFALHKNPWYDKIIRSYCLLSVFVTQKKGDYIMTVWRIQSNTSKLNIAEYCINNHIAAMGWSLLEYEGETSDLQFDTLKNTVN